MSNWIDLENINPNMKKHDCFIAVCFNENDGNFTYHSLNLPVYPEDVTNSFSTSYNSVSILGRPGTIGNYQNTGDVTTQFTLKLHRELPTLNNIKEKEPGENIDRIVSLIQAAQYPKLDVGIRIPITMYKFGDTLLIGKQTSVNVKWHGTLIDGKYMACDININIANVPKKILTFDDVRSAVPRGIGMFKNDLNYNYTNNIPNNLSSLWN